MDDVLGFLDFVVEALTMLVDFVLSTIENIVNLVSTVVLIVPQLPNFTLVAPLFISTSAMLVISIGVIKLLLGWGNS